MELFKMTKNVLRKTVSMTAVFTFIYLAFSGIVMFFIPPGRIAYWADWQVFGMTKTMYNQTHQTVSILFLAAMVLHIWLNWGAIMKYMKNRSGKFIFFTKETTLGFVLSIIFIAGTLSLTAPFGNFVQAVDDYREGYGETLGNPPYGHAELSTLAVFIKKMNLDSEKAEEMLKDNNIRYDMDKNLKTIGEENRMSPAGIYEIIKHAKSESEKKADSEISSDGIDYSKYDALAGSGMGKKTIADAAEHAGVGIDKAMANLKKNGIEAEPDAKLKDVAEASGIVPMDIYIIIDTGLKPDGY